MANPDSRHYLDHDVFTYISALPNPDKNKDTATFRNVSIRQGDSLFYSRGFITLEKILTRDGIPVKGFGRNDKATIASLKIHSFNQTSYNAEALMIEREGNRFSIPDTVMAESLILQLNKVEGDVAEIGLKESSSILEYVTLKAYKFPFINLFWLGILITALGIIMSMVRRIRVNKLKSATGA
jgi:cytochrome c-type biogenesis protein CcmF